MSETKALTMAAEDRTTEPGSVDVAIGVAGANQTRLLEAILQAALPALERFQPLKAAVLFADGGVTAGNPGVTFGAVDKPEWLSLVSAQPDEPRTSRTPGVQSPGLAIRSLLETARRLGVKAWILLDSDGATPAAAAIGRMLDGVLARELDFVAPYYRRQRFGGSLTRGVVYPVTRALYGKRVRFPFGPEFACSTQMLARFLARTGWSEEPSRTAVELALSAEALSSGLKVGQAFTGTRMQAGADLGDDLPRVLHGVLSPLFSEVERRVPIWQKIRGSEPVELIGTPTPVEPDAATFDPEKMLQSFRLGQENLQDVWGLVLPPSTLLELKRLARRPLTESGGFADLLWARVVYDFALAYHTRVMSRDHLLAAFTPLYLGWFGSFIQELAHADPFKIEQRVEKLCLQYEAEKPYLISRWRWPDRFNP